MSDTTIFATVKTEKRKFLSLEHGAAKIQLCIIESNPHVSLCIEMDGWEAEKLAEDLMRRAEEIK